MIVFFANSYARYRNFMGEHPLADNQSVCKFIRGTYDILGYHISTIVFLTPPGNLPQQVVDAYNMCIARQSPSPTLLHLY
jgi:hypothetical protein